MFTLDRSLCIIVPSACSDLAVPRGAASSDNAAADLHLRTGHGRAVPVTHDGRIPIIEEDSN